MGDFLYEHTNLKEGRGVMVHDLNKVWNDRKNRNSCLQNILTSHDKIQDLNFIDANNMYILQNWEDIILYTKTEPNGFDWTQQKTFKIKGYYNYFNLIGDWIYYEGFNETLVFQNLKDGT
jgi:hypothetical protein